LEEKRRRTCCTQSSPTSPPISLHAAALEGVEPPSKLGFSDAEDREDREERIERERSM